MQASSLGTRFFMLSMGMMFFLTGCATSSAYKAPVLPSSVTWQAALPHHANIGLLKEWWKQFNDSTLDFLLEAAENDSPTLQKALARIEEARALVRTANGATQPRVSTNLSMSQARSSLGSSGENSSGLLTTTTLMSGLDASWEGDLWGSLRSTVESADANAQARIGEWHDARISLASEVANNYMAYRSCALQVIQREHEYSSREKTVKIVQQAMSAGVLSQNELRMAEINLLNASSNLLSQKAQCETLIKSLVALTGLPEIKVREQLNLPFLQMPAPVEFIVETLPAQLVSQRPDLVVSERLLAATWAEINKAEANRYPRFSLMGSISLTTVYAHGNHIQLTPWSFGPALSLPIFDGGQRKEAVAIAHARYAQALAAYKQAVRSAIKEVEQALVKLNSARLRMQLAQQALESQRLSYSATEKQWKAGGASHLVLEEVKRAVYAAEIAYLTMQHEHIQSWIALYKALGGGWHQDALSSDPKVNASLSSFSNMFSMESIHE